MPLYTFECTQCKRQFEALVPMQQREQVRCDQCGGAVERVYAGKGVFGVQFRRESNAPCPGMAQGCPGCAAHRPK